jgi:hypothetical protein
MPSWIRPDLSKTKPRHPQGYVCEAHVARSLLLVTRPSAGLSRSFAVSRDAEPSRRIALLDAGTGMSGSARDVDSAPPDQRAQIRPALRRRLPAIPAHLASDAGHSRRGTEAELRHKHASGVAPGGDHPCRRIEAVCDTVTNTESMESAESAGHHC